MSHPTQPRLSPHTVRDHSASPQAVPFDRSGDAGSRVAGRTETAWPEHNAQRQSEQLAERFVASLLRSAHVLRGALSEQLTEFGLSDVRCTVLSFLRDSGSNGSSQRALARELCQSESSVSTLCDRMAADGLLKREPAPNDRRRRVLTLTESGREMLDSVNQVRGRRCHSMLKGFTEVELQRCNILLSTLADHLANRTSSVSLLSSDEEKSFEQRRAA